MKRGIRLEREMNVYSCANLQHRRENTGYLSSSHSRSCVRTCRITLSTILKSWDDFEHCQPLIVPDHWTGFNHSLLDLASRNTSNQNNAQDYQKICNHPKALDQMRYYRTKILDDSSQVRRVLSIIALTPSNSGSWTCTIQRQLRQGSMISSFRRKALALKWTLDNLITSWI